MAEKRYAISFDIGKNLLPNEKLLVETYNRYPERHRRIYLRIALLMGQIKKTTSNGEQS